MATPSIDIMYAAHTASCTFLLDAEGICLRIVMAPKGKRRDSTRTAFRCVGAQYVASVDTRAAGGLVEMPRVGAAMLFARVDERGRVSLVRTSTVTRFESQALEDPFRESGTVQTSAPMVAVRSTTTESTAYRRPAKTDPEASNRCDEESDLTQRIQALRQEDIEAALDRDLRNEQMGELTTADYDAVDEQEAMRHARVLAPPSSRGMPPRRSDPQMRAAAGPRWTPGHDAGRAMPRPYDSDVQVRPRR